LGGAGGGLAPQFGSLLAHSRHYNDDDSGSYGSVSVGDDIVVIEYHKLSWHQRLFGL
jgi:hypothetical protein